MLLQLTPTSCNYSHRVEINPKSYVRTEKGHIEVDIVGYQVIFWCRWGLLSQSFPDEC